jgi:histidinol-phosphatase
MRPFAGALENGMGGELDLEDDLALAHRLADVARSISMARFRGELERRTKHDGSLVTDADVAVEDAVRRAMLRERPADAMLGEERGETGAGRRRWIVDAIDGTVSFAAGQPHWGTLIALELDGRVMVGVCDEPAQDRRYWAVRGGGAFRARGGEAPRRLAVSAAASLEAARSFVPEPQWLRSDAARDKAARLSARTRPEPPLGHPALQVAEGAYELAVFFMAGPWDLAAPAIVVEEAGGKFSDVHGAANLVGRGGVFTNGRVHDAVIAITAV